LQKDKFNRFFLQTDQHAGVRFTSEEAAFLKQLVLTAGKQNKLKDAVLSKIYLASDIQISAAHLVNAKNGLIGERLAQAMANKEQVILKRYHSINTESISDRVVEPFGFTDNYHTVMAFEPSSGKNKTYHLDRITTVEFNYLPFAHVEKHEQQIADAFGFSFSGEKHQVDLDLTLKNYLLLKNEYPMVIPFVKFNAAKDVYELRMEVNSMEPVRRFERGAF
ncbi:MAG: hypothetical protein ORN53_08965, partial [Crocinitomicaceae bacterium]|nr:hypothetical protein [Crocinitomicaceae bacterium]